MRALTLREFYEDVRITAPSAYREELYVVRDSSGQALYVGISNRGIWLRWFGSRGRMRQLPSGRWFGIDSTAWTIIDNMPQSWAWTIELWTVKDCAEALGAKLGDDDTRGSQRFEPGIIQLLQPRLNGTYNG